jgi:hypothetical protein
MAANAPTDVANQALDAIAIDNELGDIEEGGRVANVTLRAYGQCRAQLLRAAPWTFARKQVPLVLLADASGQTPNVGTQVPGSNFVYEYAYPIDSARVRYIPSNPFFNPGAPSGNIVPADSAAPIMTSINANPGIGARIRPAKYLVTNDPNYSAPPGSNAGAVQGQSPQGNTVILTNVPQASCVYTFDALYPSLWDHLFRAAMVAYLAQEIALPLWVQKDKKFGLQVRAQQIAIAKEKIMQARIADGNEMFASSDIPVDWMAARNTGGSGGGFGFGPGIVSGFGLDGTYGCWGGGWGGSAGFADGSAY